MDIVIRGYTSSDYSVFWQILVTGEYRIVLKIFELNSQSIAKTNIIDAGGNIGLTSVFFAFFLKESQIFTIEPSDENCKILFENVKKYKNIKVYQNALSEKPNTYFNLDRGFRDGKDWAITTKESLDGQVKGITINEIIIENKLDYISLLKIDIEGAERFIIREENDLKFLEVTYIIAIEIHDEFNIRNLILDILIKNNFFLIESGELTIGINKNLLM